MLMFRNSFLLKKNFPLPRYLWLSNGVLHSRPQLLIILNKEIERKQVVHIYKLEFLMSSFGRPEALVCAGAVLGVRSGNPCFPPIHICVLHVCVTVLARPSVQRVCLRVLACMECVFLQLCAVGLK